LQLPTLKESGVRVQRPHLGNSASGWPPLKGCWKEHPFNKSARAGKTINIGNLTESTVWHSTAQLRPEDSGPLAAERGANATGTPGMGTLDWGSIIHLVVHDPYLLEFLVRVWRAKKYKNKPQGTYGG